MDEINIDDAHQHCCYCILTTIWLSRELKIVLYDVLREQLNMDCIDVIVCCLIGKVVHTEFTSSESSSSNKKRMIENVTGYIPDAKRRKLNEITA